MFVGIYVHKDYRTTRDGFGNSHYRPLTPIHALRIRTAAILLQGAEACSIRRALLWE